MTGLVNQLSGNELISRGATAVREGVPEYGPEWRAGEECCERRPRFQSEARCWSEAESRRGRDRCEAGRPGDTELRAHRYWWLRGGLEGCAGAASVEQYGIHTRHDDPPRRTTTSRVSAERRRPEARMGIEARMVAGSRPVRENARCNLTDSFIGRIFNVYTNMVTSDARRISKWGNSLGIRIPKAFSLETGLAEGSEVDISVSGGRIVLTPWAGSMGSRSWPIRSRQRTVTVKPTGASRSDARSCDAGPRRCSVGDGRA